MAIVKEIKIVADNSDAKKAAEELKTSLKGVDKEAGKAGKSIDEVAGNGGAIAVLDQLTGGLATRLKDAYEASKLFNFSLKATRGALIATGIGAFVVALGLVVAYWDDIKMFITGSNGELEHQIDLLGDEGMLLDRNLKVLTDTDNILKLQGLSQAEINELKRKELVKIIEIRGQELLLAQERLSQIKEQEKAGIGSIERMFRFAQDSATSFGLLFDRILGSFGLSTEFGENVSQAADSAIEKLFGTEADKKEVETRINDLTDQINAAKNQIAGFDIELREAAQKAAEEAAKRPKVQSLDPLSSEGFGSVSDDPEVIFEQEKADRLLETEEELTRRLIEEGRKRLLAEEITRDAKVAINDSYLNSIESGLSILGGLFEENRELQAAVLVGTNIAKIAENIISTQAANAKIIAEGAALAIPTGGASTAAAAGLVTANTISSGISIAASVAATAKGLAGLGKGGNTGGGFGSANGGGGVSAPSFNLVQGTGSNQIASGLGSGSNPVRAYVVSGDVTSGQELDRNIQGDASLG